MLCNICREYHETISEAQECLDNQFIEEHFTFITVTD